MMSRFDGDDLGLPDGSIYSNYSNREMPHAAQVGGYGQTERVHAATIPYASALREIVAGAPQP